MNKLLIVGIICLIGLIACENKKKGSYIVIDLKNTINDKGPNDLKLNDLSKEINLIPIETNDSILLSFIQIASTTKESVVIYDKKTVYFINQEDGSVSSMINKSGEGPEEYISIFEVSIRKAEKEIYIYDSNKRSTKVYTFSGNFVKSIQNDSIGLFKILNDGFFAVSYPPFTNMAFALGIYDSSWNLKRRGIPKTKDRKFAMDYFDDIAEFNNDFYYKLAFCDTLYRISSKIDEPHLFISKGIYRMPEQLAASLSEMDKNGDKYIQQDYGYLISKYYFLTYYYNRNKYYEIWDTENSSLIYKSQYGPNGGINGIPVIIKEKEFHVWPSYVSGNSLYCLIEGDDAISLIPSLPSDTNPIILEVKIK